jgi:3-hydroxyisobutyrate dehydrogenase-like beta-hydroxyacid dehydrogenase/alkylhydroperoxidase/carboxymuconolactone decarboxylase family protein YurZ
MSVQQDIATDVVNKELSRVGIVGLGMIGGGVAVSLERSGRTPTVYDIDPAAARRLSVELPAADSAAAVARNSDVVLLAVVDVNQVRAVLRGDNGVLAGAHPGLIVVVLSTLAVHEVLELARECAESGVALLDCGVTPGDRAADNGMVAMVGGDGDTVRRATPVLADFAKNVVHCGPLGAGMATKIARNVVTYGSWRVMHEAAKVARAGGVDPTVLLSVLDEADPEGATMTSLLRGRLNRPELMDEHAVQMLTLMDKDLAAAQDLAHRVDLDVPVVDATRAHGADTMHLQQGRDRHDGVDHGVEKDRASIGLETMATVYGAELVDRMPEDRSPVLAATIDHLFGEVWSRPGLSIRDRRLLVLGATAALGRADLIEVQARGALLNKELTAGELEELVLQLHYYVGWGNGTRVQEGVSAALRSVQNTA